MKRILKTVAALFATVVACLGLALGPANPAHADSYPYTCTAKSQVYGAPLGVKAQTCMYIWYDYNPSSGISERWVFPTSTIYNETNYYGGPNVTVYASWANGKITSNDQYGSAWGDLAWCSAGYIAPGTSLSCNNGSYTWDYWQPSANRTQATAKIWTTSTGWDQKVMTTSWL